MANFQLDNAANWDKIYTVKKEAVFMLPETYSRIPEFQIPFLFDTHVLIILITSDTAPSHWRFAGFLNTQIATGITSGGLTQTDTGESRRLYLNRARLLLDRNISTTYSLSFFAPIWLKDITLDLWNYTGPTPGEIPQNLTGINFK